jgi:transcriptional regulator with XRE-family HTH domain
MKLTAAQAQALGRLIATARRRKGLSVRQAAALLGVNKSWLSYLEQGRIIEAPAADRLARVSDVLAIPPARIDRLTKGTVTANLPGVRAYFRAKYQLAPEEVERIARYVSRFVKEEAA